MNVSVSTYSFSDSMKAGILTQKDCIAKAKELGFDAVEIESLHHDDTITDAEYAKELREEAERLQFPISNFTFGADLLNAFDGDTDKEVARIKTMIDLAEILGVKSIRHDCTIGFPSKKRKASYDTVLPILAKACREITEYAAAKGIATTVENHGFFSQDSDRVEKLIVEVAHDNFGLLLDIGNFCCVDEDSTIAVGRAAPYASYVHAKDFHLKSGMLPNPGNGFFQSRAGNYIRGSIIGHGDIPVLQCLKALKKAGYDGTISIEFEGMEDPLLALPISLENLRNYWNQA